MTLVRDDLPPIRIQRYYTYQSPSPRTRRYLSIITTGPKGKQVQTFQVLYELIPKSGLNKPGLGRVF